MKLREVRNVSFKLNIPNKQFDGNDIQLKFSNNLTHGKDNKSLTLTTGVRYMFKRRILLECIESFVFEFENLTDFIVPDGTDKFIIKGELLPKMLNITIGAIRGIMIAKTEGTSLQAYPLPLVDARRVLEMFATEVKD